MKLSTIVTNLLAIKFSFFSQIEIECYVQSYALLDLIPLNQNIVGKFNGGFFYSL